MDFLPVLSVFSRFDLVVLDWPVGAFGSFGAAVVVTVPGAVMLLTVAVMALLEGVVLFVGTLTALAFYELLSFEAMVSDCFLGLWLL